MLVNSGDLAHQDPAVARCASMHHSLMIGTQQKNAARDRASRPAPGFACRRGTWWPAPRIVDRLPVGAGRERDVIRILVPALNLDRRDADLHDLRNLLQRVQVARRTADSARPPAASFHRRRSVRMGGGKPARIVRDSRSARPTPLTKSTVRNRPRRVRRGRRFRARNRWPLGMARTWSSESSRANVTRLAPRLCARAHPVDAGDAHLRAGVNLERGGDLPHQFQDADVLHDHGVRARCCDRC